MLHTVLEVSRHAFLDNFDSVRKLVGENIEIMPVIKANAYGTFLNKDIHLMNEFNIVGVAQVCEAIELRKNGYEKDIFVLNQPFLEDIQQIIDNNVVVGVSNFDFIRQAGMCDSNIRVHIELETGMGRTGVSKGDLMDFLSIVTSFPNIIVEGVYTHLSSADKNYEFTNKQISLFKEMVSVVKREFPNIKYIHQAASNGIMNFDLGICNMVRPGIILYGYYSSKSSTDKIHLKPAVELKSKVLFIKKVGEGYSVGYDRGYVTNSSMVIATVGMGYADGVRRMLANKGFVSIRGVKCKIIGNICMDSFMVDVTNVKDISVGDDVYLIDNKTVTLDEVARICETINYEILSTIGDRVQRVFVD